MSSLRWPCPDLLTMSPCSFFVSLQCMLVVVRPPGMKCSWCFGMLIYCDDGQIRPFGTLWLISRFLSPLRIAGLRKYYQIRIHREQPISALCDIKRIQLWWFAEQLGHTERKETYPADERTPTSGRTLEDGQKRRRVRVFSDGYEIQDEESEKPRCIAGQRDPRYG